MSGDLTAEAKTEVNAEVTLPPLAPLPPLPPLAPLGPLAPLEYQHHVPTQRHPKLHAIDRMSLLTSTSTFERQKFECAICKDLLLDLVETKCGHVFCGRCIHNGSLDGSNGLLLRCPFDRTLFALVATESPALNLMVSSLDVLCPYNQKVVEEAEHSQDDETVVAISPPTPSSTTSLLPPCKWRGTYGKLFEHLAIDLVFDVNVPTLSTVCMMATGRCSKCQLYMTVAESKTHIDSCPAVVNPCVNCNEPIKRQDLSDHDTLHCRRRSISCPHIGCQTTLPFDTLPDHQSSCQYRLLSCPLNELMPGTCSGAFPAHESNIHLDLVHLNLICQAVKQAHKVSALSVRFDVGTKLCLSRRQLNRINHTLVVSHRNATVVDNQLDHNGDLLSTTLCYWKYDLLPKLETLSAIQLAASFGKIL